MRLLSKAHGDQQTLSHSGRLWQTTHQLRELAEAMRADGFREEADSLETTVRDLHWTYESLINKELVGEWPNGPRRPTRAPLSVVR